MWDLNVSVPDHCLSFYYAVCFLWLSLADHYRVADEALLDETM